MRVGSLHLQTVRPFSLKVNRLGKTDRQEWERGDKSCDQYLQIKCLSNIYCETHLNGVLYFNICMLGGKKLYVHCRGCHGLVKYSEWPVLYPYLLVGGAVATWIKTRHVITCLDSCSTTSMTDLQNQRVTQILTYTSGYYALHVTWYDHFGTKILHLVISVHYEMKTTLVWFLGLGLEGLGLRENHKVGDEM